MQSRIIIFIFHDHLFHKFSSLCTFIRLLSPKSFLYHIYFSLLSFFLPLSSGDIFLWFWCLYRSSSTFRCSRQSTRVLTFRLTVSTVVRPPRDHSVCIVVVSPSTVPSVTWLSKVRIHHHDVKASLGISLQSAKYSWFSSLDTFKLPKPYKI